MDITSSTRQNDASSAMTGGLLITGGLAALIATIGDLQMLHVANTISDHSVVSGPARILPWGYYLGILGIACYGLGFRGAGSLLTDSRSALWVRASGTGLATIGVVIHGVTGMFILSEFSGQPFPSTAFVVYLAPLWLLAAVCLLIASWWFGAAVWRGRSLLPRRWALVNPLSFICLIALASAPFDLIRDYGVPAAPNAGLTIFFMFSYVAYRRIASPELQSDRS